MTRQTNKQTKTTWHQMLIGGLSIGERTNHIVIKMNDRKFSLSACAVFKPCLHYSSVASYDKCEDVYFLETILHKSARPAQNIKKRKAVGLHHQPCG